MSVEQNNTYGIKETMCIDDIDTYLGKYVIVSYKGSAYPGFVKDIGYDDIFVTCMHKVGRKENDRFFWPKKLQMNAGTHQKMFSLLFQSQKKNDGSHSHNKVQEYAWKLILEKLRK